MNLKISKGITASQIQELIIYSNNDLLVKQTTTDYIRFKDEAAANAWFKNRKVYTLSDDSGKLFGIVWFGEKDMPEANYPEEFKAKQYKITFGIRIYDKARGKGFSKKLFEEGFNLFRQTEDYKNITNNKIWLSTKVNNHVAISLYEKLGFVKIAEDTEGGKILMV